MKFKMETRLDRTRTDAARNRSMDFRNLRKMKAERWEAK
jgi:hypothetical protein